MPAGGELAGTRDPGDYHVTRGFAEPYGPTLRFTLMVALPVTSTSSKGDVVALIPAVTVLVGAQLGAAVTRRNAVDTGALKEIRDIVHGVRGDREEGEDGELYEQMGYVRTSDRSTGLTRRRAMDQSNGGSEAA